MIDHNSHLQLEINRRQNQREYEEGMSNFKEEQIQATISDREQIIKHFKIVINIEKSYLFHASLSIILCVMIQFGFLQNENVSQNNLTITNEQQQNQLIMPKDPLSGIIDFYVVSLIQNAVYIYMLYKIIGEDRQLLNVMKHILQQEKDEIIKQSAKDDSLKKQFDQEIQNSAGLLENQALHQNDERLISTLSIIDSLLQENFIIQRRNRVSRSSKEKKSHKPSYLKKCEDSSQKEDQHLLKVKNDLFQFEQGIIHHRVNSKKDHITLFNVLENNTETQNFGSKLFITATSVIIYVYNIAQINTNYLNPEYELGVLLFLGIPALAMILPFCFVLLTLATSVVFLLIYGVSILLLLTYSVISKQLFYLIKIGQLRSTAVKSLPHLIGQTCSICLFEYENEAEKVSYLKCNHAFHYECIKLWMQEKDDCPMCRKKQ
ncbi:zinc finger, C3HC4 type (RING finger) protein (macronuclear) [Tetrahymena thermophila SB210]|uniref:Zinc finger, C3HC4 type (RING finger) protein n=1 Tax=Tetrahymena thermophila (strain SB210) TaxID=312017 RepID=I7MAN5_TETTS|nr:zinc finger, C3HC4 type (RING finger) protein [Tetrahymena thermophila SB210]EAS04943.1 zinc finger, C3HC4 type (RING finger) protein [Tetrahymena thermophila SB210]|eukprot:XP_001025188.1 zinc finger, C3HC4 type (RING finger) protein [Tetrahymena thermophila SB210]